MCKYDDFYSAQPAHNDLKTSPNGSILIKTFRTIIVPKSDIQLKSEKM